jgi:cytidine deaminase
MPEPQSDADRALLDAARNAEKQSYAPYTNTTTGAAVRSRDGRIFTGCKIELASFIGSICAEQAAIANAVVNGARDLEALAFYPAAFPCGTCRQWMVEFNPDFVVILERDGAIERHPLSQLLPNSFGPHTLKPTR